MLSFPEKCISGLKACLPLANAISRAHGEWLKNLSVVVLEVQVLIKPALGKEFVRTVEIPGAVIGCVVAHVYHSLNTC